MTVESTNLKSKFAELLRWERRKRREQICLMVACCAVGTAFLLFPLHSYFTMPWLRWLVPLALFALFAPLWFIRRRWRPLDTTRAITGLDKALRLDERAITAWELIARDHPGSPAQWLLHQTEARLHGVAPRALFPRRRNWPGYLVLPLFVLWFALLWFDIDHKLFAPGNAAPLTLAHRLRQFARELTEKAQGEGLRESLKLGQDLEKIAAKNLAANSDEQQLKKDLAGTAKKLDAIGKSAADKQNFAAAESQQSLRDLKAELEAARDLLSFPDSDKAGADLAQQSLDRLAALPQLHRQFEKETAQGQRLGQNQLKEFLGNLDRQVTNELDRRAVLDAQKYLEQMMQPGQREQGEANLRGRGRESGDEPESGEKSRTQSNRPGTEPGQKDETAATLPPFRSGAETQVKGQLGAGDSSSIVFKGKPTPGKSEISQEQVVASYRRQAEQELNSERVPDALKETIKNYFLSLGEKK
ncbi:MAG: hypothetical protein ACREQO_27255 [Candidatus Binatia bacterium]